jgi:WD40 repeat protein
MELIHTLTYSKPVLITAFSPDSRFFTSGSGDKTINIWELKSGKIVQSASGDKTIKVWKLDYQRYPAKPAEFRK